MQCDLLCSNAYHFQCWENGIILCRELADQYEAYYDYRNLSKMRVSQFPDEHLKRIAIDIYKIYTDIYGSTAVVVIFSTSDHEICMKLMLFSLKLRYHLIIRLSFATCK